MSTCIECGKPTLPFKFRVGPVDKTPRSVCRSCRGKRSAAVNKAKAAIHGPGYFDRRSANARRA